MDYNNIHVGERKHHKRSRSIKIGKCKQQNVQNLPQVSYKSIKMNSINDYINLNKVQ